MLPTTRDQRARPLHEGLLAASADHRQTAMSTWARSALDRSEKLLTLCASLDVDVASRAGSGLTTVTANDLRATARPLELLRRALPEGDHGLGILVWADAVITATSRATHTEIETTLADLCRDHAVSVLCVYDRDGERNGAGTEHLDLAVARHPDELQEERLVLRLDADTLHVDGEIDASNLDVFGTALRALTDTPSPTVRINLGGVTFLAAAGARTLIRVTAPYRDSGADVEIDASPTSPGSSNCSTSTGSPGCTSAAEGSARRANDRRNRLSRRRGGHRRAGTASDAVHIRHLPVQ